MTLKEQRIQMGLTSIEIAYCEAIDREIHKTSFYIPSTSSLYGGSFYWTQKYQKLSDMLVRYRKMNGR